MKTVKTSTRIVLIGILTIGLAGCGDTTTPVDNYQDTVKQTKQLEKQLNEQTSKINEMSTNPPTLPSE